MTVLHPAHKKILQELDDLKISGDKKERAWVQKYLGSNKPTRCIKTDARRKIAKSISKNIDSVDLINSLYKNATSFEEIDIAAMLIGLNSKLRQDMDLSLLDNWLNYTVGWAETDVLCQSNFSAVEILSRWSKWKKFLLKLSKDKNIHKRRASMVLLCKSLRQSDDLRISDLAFKLVDKLKSEKEILITKAVSWILRSLVKFHAQELAIYLEKNRESLPRIAYREATKKLTTGRKN